MPGVWGLAPTGRAEEVTRVGPTARSGEETEEAIAEACRGGYDVWGTSQSEEPEVSCALSVLLLSFSFARRLFARPMFRN